MDALARIEQALHTALSRTQTPDSPPLLTDAMRAAVFPRGARVRPRLVMAVAAACGPRADLSIAETAGASIEFLHCASLVHDDLPCFDDASLRRGRPTVHRKFGQPLAVLAGDALIVLAFQNLARVAHAPQRLASLLVTIGRAVGAPHGIVAGQAWECEPRIDVPVYHRAKTASLFSAATACGAIAAGADPDIWRVLGERLGEAYQVADDIGDMVGQSEDMGKPVGQDSTLGRPSASRELGIAGALQRLEQLVKEASASIPDCAGAADLRALIKLEAVRLVPKEVAQFAA